MGSRNRVTLLRSFLLIVNCSQGLEPHSFVFCNPHVRLFFLNMQGAAYLCIIGKRMVYPCGPVIVNISEIRISVVYV
jgi:hypothetical protein